MQRFKLRNLACASCVKKVEKELLSLENIKSARINFSTNTLYIQALNEAACDAKAIELAIQRVEPEVEIEAPSNPGQTSHVKSKSLVLGLSSAAFILGLVLLHTSLLGDGMELLAYSAFGISYVISGYPVFRATLSGLARRSFFNENCLMVFATLAALCIGELAEAAAVMLFFSVGALLESISVEKSKRSVNALLEILPSSAHRRGEKGQLEEVHPELLEVGDLIIVQVGEKVPTDGVILKGSSYLDLRALNGESKPVSAREGDLVKAGAINTSAVLELRVSGRFQDSHIAKIQELVDKSSSNKARTQKVIDRFAGIYMPIVVAVSLIVAIVPPLALGGGAAVWSDWIYRALVVLMVSCPCALVISVPLGYFGALGLASREGILIKGQNHLETLADVKNLIFDKTGTLTKGVFTVTHIEAINGTKEELLKLALCAESLSKHPIAQSLQEMGKQEGIEVSPPLECEEKAGEGLKAVDSKGIVILAGNARLMQRYNLQISEASQAGSIVHIASGEEGDLTYKGYICISDVIKEEAPGALDKLRALGVVRTAVLSGDNEASTKAIASKLGLETYHANLLPAQKAELFSKLKEGYMANGAKGDKTAFVGDGINDAGVLSLADVGVSIGGDSGADLSKESADVILTTSSLNALVRAIEIAKKTRLITWQNIGFALATKFCIAGLGVAGVANMWLAVFGDVGVSLLALANALRCIR